MTELPLLKILKPRLRGRIHQVAVPIAVAAGIVLAALSPAGNRRTATIVYAVTLTLLFAVSATYHRSDWGARASAVLRRMDHSTILFFIAGTFTPLAVVATHGSLRVLLLVAVWAAAAAGVVIRQAWHHAPPGATALVYAIVGLCAGSVLPFVYMRSGVSAFVLFLLGGVIYLGGALVYAKRRPDPRPTVFGYHEVFHGLTVIAAILQYVGLSLAILTTPALS